MQNSVLFKSLFLTLFTLLSLQANILTQYRMHGIDGIEKQMDFDLTNHEYWDDYLSDIDTSFGYIESYDNILLCDKSQSTLSLYMKDKENRYRLTKTYDAFTGKVKGDKVREGDLKTPVGIYNIVKKLSKVDSFYGPMAFVTSYPNTYDKYRGKDGSGIWIHGLPISQERDSFTKGCIAIKNSSIECLDRNINIKKTVLIIDESRENKKISKDDLSDVLAELYDWRYAWLYNDIESYLNFYDASFVRYDGMNIENFKRYKTRVFNKKESKKIIFTNINVIPYPNSDNLYKITFWEFYKSSSFTFSGEKVLIVKLKDSKISIITEK